MTKLGSLKWRNGTPSGNSWNLLEDSALLTKTSSPFATLVLLEATPNRKMLRNQLASARKRGLSIVRQRSTPENQKITRELIDYNQTQAPARREKRLEAIKGSEAYKTKMGEMPSDIKAKRDIEQRELALDPSMYSHPDFGVTPEQATTSRREKIIKYAQDSFLNPNISHSNIDKYIKSNPGLERLYKHEGYLSGEDLKLSKAAGFEDQIAIPSIHDNSGITPKEAGDRLRDLPTNDTTLSKSELIAQFNAENKKKESHWDSLHKHGGAQSLPEPFHRKTPTKPDRASSATAEPGVGVDDKAVEVAIQPEKDTQVHPENPQKKARRLQKAAQLSRDTGAVVGRIAGMLPSERGLQYKGLRKGSLEIYDT